MVKDDEIYEMQKPRPALSFRFFSVINLNVFQEPSTPLVGSASQTALLNICQADILPSQRSYCSDYEDLFPEPTLRNDIMVYSYSSGISTWCNVSLSNLEPVVIDSM